MKMGDCINHKWRNYVWISGLIMYYSIELGQVDSFLRLIKNSGTFIGFSGI